MKKRLTPLYLPTEAFAFIAMIRHELGVRGAAALADPVWKLFFLGETAVERFFVEAHQRNLLQYHAAGSLARIGSPPARSTTTPMSSLKPCIEWLERELPPNPPRVKIHEDLPFAILRYFSPLPRLVAERLNVLDPDHSVAFLFRAAALAPSIYHISKLLDELQGKTRVPAVLCYPGELVGTTSLRFMGLASLHSPPSYRVKIYG